MIKLMPSEIDPLLPLTVQQHLRNGGMIEEIRLSERGIWTHEGGLFVNTKIKEAFSRSIKRTKSGNWILEMGTYVYPIIVEDTGFFVDRITLGEGTTPPRITLSDGTEEDLDLSTVQLRPPDRLTCRIKGGMYEARFKRDAYYGLLSECEEREEGVLFRGKHITITGKAGN